jgi:membrane protein implicated in regulation of membrane protease activity
MTLSEALIVIACILILVDFFVPTDVPTHGAYILFTVAFGRQFETPLLYQILIGLGFWFVVVTFHYIVWRKFVQAIANRYIAPEQHQSGVDGMLGRTGKIQIHEQSCMVMIDGDLWECTSSSPLKHGEEVCVIRIRDGVLVVQK